MRLLDIDEEVDRQAFARRAALKFSGNSSIATYSDREIEEGCYLALRWGMMDDNVLVVKVGPDPVIYRNMIPEEDSE